MNAHPDAGGHAEHDTCPACPHDRARTAARRATEAAGGEWLDDCGILGTHVAGWTVYLRDVPLPTAGTWTAIEVSLTHTTPTGAPCACQQGRDVVCLIQHHHVPDAASEARRFARHVTPHLAITHLPRPTRPEGTPR